MQIKQCITYSLLIIVAAITEAQAATQATPAAVQPTQTTNQPAPALVLIGQVVWVKGAIIASNADDNSLRHLKRGSPVYQHDKIETSSSSSGQIVFTDNSMVALRSDTVFQVDSYKYTPGKKVSEEKYGASLLKGGFQTITGVISKDNPQNYQVVTPVATIGVRGTKYSLYYGSQGLSVKLDRGIITVVNPAGSLELNPAQNRAFATVNSIAQAPQVQAKPAAVFQSQPPVVEGYTIAPGTQRTGGTSETSNICVVR